MSQDTRRSFIKSITSTSIAVTSAAFLPSACSKTSDGRMAPAPPPQASDGYRASKKWEVGGFVAYGDIRTFNNLRFIYVGAQSGNMASAVDSNWRILQEWQTGYVTVDDLGLINNNDCTLALKIFSKLAAAGVCSVIHFLAKDYYVSESIAFMSPVSIHGAGALFGVDDQRAGTRLHDAREGNSGGFLLNFESGSRPTCSLRLTGVEFVGREVVGNSAILLSLAGWTIFIQNVIVRDFHAVGIKFDMVNDGTYEDVHILNCGGKLGNEVYYSLDLVSSGSRYTNHSVFLRLHIEHSRYQINLAGFFVHFIGCHFEVGNAKSVDTTVPVINVQKIARPINFTNCDFVASPATQGATQEGNGGVAFIAATHARKQIEGIDRFNTLLSLSQCNFCTPNGSVYFIDLSEVSVNLESSTFINCISLPKASVRVGAMSRVLSNHFVVSSGNGQALELCGDATVLGNTFVCTLQASSAISYKGKQADAVGLNNLIGYHSVL